jgi:hypothetical protein
MPCDHAAGHEKAADHEEAVDADLAEPGYQPGEEVDGRDRVAGEHKAMVHEDHAGERHADQIEVIVAILRQFGEGRGLLKVVGQCGERADFRHLLA